MEINITSEAVQKLNKMLKDANQASKKIRIAITGIGWGGPRFGVALDEQQEKDKTIKAENLDFIVDKNLAEQVNTFHIDYKDYFLNKGFQVYASGYKSSFC